MSLDALFTEQDGGALLSAPRLGLFRAAVRAGDAVAPGQVLGTLEVLGRFHDVVAPATAAGRVRRVVASVRDVGVAYGEPLLEIEAAEGLAPGAAQTGADDAVGDAFVAPMDGQFYRRPTPEEPAFANVGDTIEPGQTIGLIEVMKFFYPIVWEGSEPRTIHAWVAEDGPVQSGDVLLRWAPRE